GPPVACLPEFGGIGGAQSCLHFGVELGVDAEVNAHSADSSLSSAHSAIDVVNACNALGPAIGPISPAAKKPASGMPPSICSIVDASWSATPNIRRPRPLQVNNNAPAGGPDS